MRLIHVKLLPDELRFDKQQPASLLFMPHFLFWDIIMESGAKIKLKEFLSSIFNHFKI